MKYPEKRILFLIAAVAIILIFIFSTPESAKEVFSKISEAMSNLGEAISKVALFPTPSNESAENETENKTEMSSMPREQHLIPKEGRSDISLSIADVQCNHFFKISIRNDGNIGVDFSNAEFYYRDSKLNVTLSTLYLDPNEVEEILIPLHGGIPIPQREHWRIDIILKDSQNSTFFSSSFIVFCIL
ncbi:MAG: hypothetical protein QMD12_00760 [Candidatus Aenigmarchaeota archaeon]|nr:hypothetical protein [Candidatus Aenigmarchaeota archaeon]